jgi:pyruvate dehydrogenase E2 component (dihydrolipoamide acetyltransferase)
MAKNVIMPALGMAQETGVLIRWLKHEGDSVSKGEPLMEIETDKATVEIETPESGFLRGVSAKAGDVIPVGQTIAWILAAGEPPTQVSLDSQTNPVSSVSQQSPSRNTLVEASPLARKIAEEHGIDLALIKSNGKRIEKADVLAYIDSADQTKPEAVSVLTTVSSPPRLTPASPKARRLAVERGIDITTLKVQVDGAVLAADIPLEVLLLQRIT